MALVGAPSHYKKGAPTSPGAEDNHVFDKTKLCKFWMKHRCKRGEECTFAHSTAELLPQPDFFKTQLCPSLGTDSPCPRGEACQFAHSEQELRKSTKNPRGPRNRRHASGLGAEESLYAGTRPGTLRGFQSSGSVPSPSNLMCNGSNLDAASFRNPATPKASGSSVSAVVSASAGVSPPRASTSFSAPAPCPAGPVTPGLVSTSQNSTAQPGAPRAQGNSSMLGGSVLQGPTVHQEAKVPRRQPLKLRNKRHDQQAGSASSSSCSNSISKIAEGSFLGQCGDRVCHPPPGSFVRSQNPSAGSSPAHLQQSTSPQQYYNPPQAQPQSQPQCLQQQNQHGSSHFQTVPATPQSVLHQQAPFWQQQQQQQHEELQEQQQYQSYRQNVWQQSQSQQCEQHVEGVCGRPHTSYHEAPAVDVVSGTTASSANPDLVAPAQCEDPPVFLPFGSAVVQDDYCNQDASSSEPMPLQYWTGRGVLEASLAAALDLPQQDHALVEGSGAMSPGPWNSEPQEDACARVAFGQDLPGSGRPLLLRPANDRDIKETWKEAAWMRPEVEVESDLGCITVKNTFLHIEAEDEEEQPKSRLRHHSLPRRIMFE